MSWNDDDTWEHMLYGPFLLLCNFLVWTKFTLFVFWNLLLYNKLIPIRTARPLSSVQSGPPESPWQVSCTKVFCWSPNLPKTIIECISLPHHQVITWPPRIKLLFFDMFFNVSGTFDTLNEPVLRIYEAKFEIWQCTWKGSAPCSYLSPALPFPVSRTRNHFTEDTFVKLKWTLPHFLLVFCCSFHSIIHIGNIHPERRIIH